MPRLAVITKRAVLIALAAGFGVVSVAAASDKATEAAAAFRLGELKKLELADEPADITHLSFLSPEGEPLSVASFEGKVVLLNFWATWCAPCIRELPSIARLDKQIEGAGLNEKIAVVALNVDKGSDLRPRKMLARIDAERLTLFRDPEYVAPRQAKLRGMPTTLIIDARGREVGRLEGEAHWDAAEAFAMLNALAEVSATE